MSCCENIVPQTITQDVVLNGKPHPKRTNPKTNSHTSKVNEEEKEQQLRKYLI
jgi:hypothetical protein